MSIVIFDLDGTLADIDHRLHHVQDGNKNWDQFYADCVFDTVNEPIAEIARWADDQLMEIVISSGRSEKVRKETEKWLDDNYIPYGELLMRPDNCYVPDNALKKAWLDEGRLGPVEDILFVIEDRDRMVQMWRGAGLTCLQVDQWVEEGEQSFPIKKIELARDMARFISATGQDQRFNDWKNAQVAA